MVPYSMLSEGLCADTGQSAAIGGDYGQLSGQKHFLVLAFLVEEMNYLESSPGNLDKGWRGGCVVPGGRFISRNESVT